MAIFALLAPLFFCGVQHGQQPPPLGGSGTGQRSDGQWRLESLNHLPAQRLSITALARDGRPFDLSFSCEQESLSAPAAPFVIWRSAVLDVSSSTRFHAERSIERSDAGYPVVSYVSWITTQTDGDAPRSYPSGSTTSDPASVRIEFPEELPLEQTQQFDQAYARQMSAPNDVAQIMFFLGLGKGGENSGKLLAEEMQLTTLGSLASAKSLKLGFNLSDGEQTVLDVPLDATARSFVAGCLANPKLHQAWLRAKLRDWNGALADYRNALGSDPDNAAANAGISAIQAIQNRTAALIADQRAQGEWWDPFTGWMWTAKDNGEDVSWSDAQEYCRALRTGGYSDWDLPDLNELGSITDAGAPERQIEKSTRKKKKNPISYQIAGGIVLTSPWIWSKQKDPTIRGEMAASEFDSMTWTNVPPDRKSDMRALCVRKYTRPGDSFNLPDPAPQLATVDLVEPGGDTWTDPATGMMWTGRDSGYELTWRGAAEYCHSVTMGGYSDWRLPTIDHLATLYDQWESGWKRHLRGGIVMSNWEAWSVSQGDKPQTAQYFSFLDGDSRSDPYGYTTYKRALCVRRPY